MFRKRATETRPTGYVLLVMAILISAGCGKSAVSQQQEDSPDTDSKPAPAADSPENEQPAQADAHPFPRRTKATEFPNDLTWINTSGHIRMRDLKGKFVLLDFWTYCCINCIHILPELKKLEKAYPNELVVIGVHSAKFDTERATKNIEEAVLRYEIEHPVVNDADHRIWDSYAVRSWPSLRVIDPEGNWVAQHSGEITFEQLDAFFKQVIPIYKRRGSLDTSPVRFELLAHSQEPTPLRFPGKVLADEKSDRLFVADSNHNRIVISTLDGKLLETIGSGAIGGKDGSFAEATFNHPQGMALTGNTLYVADTENHTLRKVDLDQKQVTTIAGTGVQGRTPWPGLELLRRGSPLPDRWVGKPQQTALNSPWALWVHKADLYIAMAGPHQIWKMPLDESEIGPYAGNSHEDVVDGELLPDSPFALGTSSFAQPSGLASDGEWLFVADSEGSSIRAVPFDPNKQVRTIVGTSELPGARLFVFGDRDGIGRLKLTVPPFAFTGDANQTEGPLLQHALGVVYRDGKIYVADTYNNKIKVVDAETGETRTLAGTGRPGRDDEPGTFDEPAGITIAGNRLYVADTNNHLIRTVNVQTGKVSTLKIDGLKAFSPPQPPQKPTFSEAVPVAVEPQTIKPTSGTITLQVKLTLPTGWKINELAPMSYFVEVKGETGPIDRSGLANQPTRVEQPATKFDIAIPVNSDGQDELKLSLNYFYCQEGGEGLCKVGSVAWTVPVSVDAAATQTAAALDYKVNLITK